ncbi:unnamed protein product [Amoebophrya sp. A25]|nr:unnamed protein product [Amoebophrya sp. A25]|eukprot:GSA25T00007090001.1
MKLKADSSRRLSLPGLVSVVPAPILPRGAGVEVDAGGGGATPTGRTIATTGGSTTPSVLTTTQSATRAQSVSVKKSQSLLQFDYHNATGRFAATPGRSVARVGGGVGLSSSVPATVLTITPPPSSSFSSSAAAGTTTTTRSSAAYVVAGSGSGGGSGNTSTGTGRQQFVQSRGYEDSATAASASEEEVMMKEGKMNKVNKHGNSQLHDGDGGGGSGAVAKHAVTVSSSSASPGGLGSILAGYNVILTKKTPAAPGNIGVVGGLGAAPRSMPRSLSTSAAGSSNLNVVVTPRHVVVDAPDTSSSNNTRAANGAKLIPKTSPSQKTTTTTSPKRETSTTSKPPVVVRSSSVVSPRSMRPLLASSSVKICSGGISTTTPRLLQYQPWTPTPPVPLKAVKLGGSSGIGGSPFLTPLSRATSTAITPQSNSRTESAGAVPSGTQRLLAASPSVQNLHATTTGIGGSSTGIIGGSSTGIGGSSPGAAGEFTSTRINTTAAPGGGGAHTRSLSVPAAPALRGSIGKPPLAPQLLQLPTTASATRSCTTGGRGTTGTIPPTTTSFSPLLGTKVVSTSATSVGPLSGSASVPIAPPTQLHLFPPQSTAAQNATILGKNTGTGRPGPSTSTSTTSIPTRILTQQVNNNSGTTGFAGPTTSSSFSRKMPQEHDDHDEETKRVLVANGSGGYQIVVHTPKSPGAAVTLATPVGDPSHGLLVGGFHDEEDEDGSVSLSLSKSSIESISNQRSLVLTSTAAPRIKISPLSLPGDAASTTSPINAALGSFFGGPNLQLPHKLAHQSATSTPGGGMVGTSIVASTPLMVEIGTPVEDQNHLAWAGEQGGGFANPRSRPTSRPTSRNGSPTGRGILKNAGEATPIALHGFHPMSTTTMPGGHVVGSLSLGHQPPSGTGLHTSTTGLPLQLPFIASPRIPAAGPPSSQLGHQSGGVGPPSGLMSSSKTSTVAIAPTPILATPLSARARGAGNYNSQDQEGEDHSSSSIQDSFLQKRDFASASLVDLWFDGKTWRTSEPVFSKDHNAAKIRYWENYKEYLGGTSKTSAASSDEKESSASRSRGPTPLSTTSTEQLHEDILQLPPSLDRLESFLCDMEGEFPRELDCFFQQQLKVTKFIKKQGEGRDSNTSKAATNKKPATRRTTLNKKIPTQLARLCRKAVDLHEMNNNNQSAASANTANKNNYSMASSASSTATSTSSWAALIEFLRLIFRYSLRLPPPPISRAVWLALAREFERYLLQALLAKCDSPNTPRGQWKAVTTSALFLDSSQEPSSTSKSGRSKSVDSLSTLLSTNKNQYQDLHAADINYNQEQEQELHLDVYERVRKLSPVLREELECWNELRRQSRQHPALTAGGEVCTHLETTTVQFVYFFMRNLWLLASTVAEPVAVSATVYLPWIRPNSILFSSSNIAANRSQSSHQGNRSRPTSRPTTPHSAKTPTESDIFLAAGQRFLQFSRNRSETPVLPRASPLSSSLKALMWADHEDLQHQENAKRVAPQPCRLCPTWYVHFRSLLNAVKAWRTAKRSELSAVVSEVWEDYYATSVINWGLTVQMFLREVLQRCELVKTLRTMSTDHKTGASSSTTPTRTSTTTTSCSGGPKPSSTTSTTTTSRFSSLDTVPDPIWYQLFREADPAGRFGLTTHASALSFVRTFLGRVIHLTTHFADVVEAPDAIEVNEVRADARSIPAKGATSTTTSTNAANLAAAAATTNLVVEQDKNFLDISPATVVFPDEAQPASLNHVEVQVMTMELAQQKVKDSEVHIVEVEQPDKIPPLVVRLQSEKSMLERQLEEMQQQMTALQEKSEQCQNEAMESAELEKERLMAERQELLAAVNRLEIEKRDAEQVRTIVETRLQEAETAHFLHEKALQEQEAMFRKSSLEAEEDWLHKLEQEKEAATRALREQVREEQGALKSELVAKQEELERLTGKMQREKQSLEREHEASRSKEHAVLKKQYVGELENLQAAYKKAMEDIEKNYSGLTRQKTSLEQEMMKQMALSREEQEKSQDMISALRAQLLEAQTTAQQAQESLKNVVVECEKNLEENRETQLEQMREERDRALAKTVAQLRAEFDKETESVKMKLREEAATERQAVQLEVAALRENYKNLVEEHKAASKEGEEQLLLQHQLHQEVDQIQHQSPSKTSSMALNTMSENENVVLKETRVFSPSQSPNRSASPDKHYNINNTSMMITPPFVRDAENVGSLGKHFRVEDLEGLTSEMRRAVKIQGSAVHIDENQLMSTLRRAAESAIRHPGTCSPMKEVITLESAGPVHRLQPSGNEGQGGCRTKMPSNMSPPVPARECSARLFQEEERTVVSPVKAIMKETLVVVHPDGKELRGNMEALPSGVIDEETTFLFQGGAAGSSSSATASVSAGAGAFETEAAVPQLQSDPSANPVQQGLPRPAPASVVLNNNNSKVIAPSMYRFTPDSTVLYQRALQHVGAAGGSGVVVTPQIYQQQEPVVETAAPTASAVQLQQNNDSHLFVDAREQESALFEEAAESVAPPSQNMSREASLVKRKKAVAKRRSALSGARRSPAKQGGTTGGTPNRGKKNQVSARSPASRAASARKKPHLQHFYVPTAAPPPPPATTTTSGVVAAAAPSPTGAANPQVQVEAVRRTSLKEASATLDRLRRDFHHRASSRSQSPEKNNYSNKNGGTTSTSSVTSAKNNYRINSPRKTSSKKSVSSSNGRMRSSRSVSPSPSPESRRDRQGQQHLNNSTRRTVGVGTSSSPPVARTSGSSTSQQMQMQQRSAGTRPVRTSSFLFVNDSEPETRSRTSPKSRSSAGLVAPRSSVAGVVGSSTATGGEQAGASFTATGRGGGQQQASSSSSNPNIPFDTASSPTKIIVQHGRRISVITDDGLGASPPWTAEVRKMLAAAGIGEQPMEDEEAGPFLNENENDGSQNFYLHQEGEAEPEKMNKSDLLVLRSASASPAIRRKLQKTQESQDPDHVDTSQINNTTATLLEDKLASGSSPQLRPRFEVSLTGSSGDNFQLKPIPDEVARSEALIMVSDMKNMASSPSHTQRRGGSLGGGFEAPRTARSSALGVAEQGSGLRPTSSLVVTLSHDPRVLQNKPTTTIKSSTSGPAVQHGATLSTSSTASNKRSLTLPELRAELQRQQEEFQSEISQIKAEHSDDIERLDRERKNLSIRESLHSEKAVSLAEEKEVYASDSMRLREDLKSMQELLAEEQERRRAADADVMRLLEASEREKEKHTEMMDNLGHRLKDLQTEARTLQQERWQHATGDICSTGTGGGVTVVTKSLLSRARSESDEQALRGRLGVEAQEAALERELSRGTSGAGLSGSGRGSNNNTTAAKNRTMFLNSQIQNLQPVMGDREVLQQMGVGDPPMMMPSVSSDRDPYPPRNNYSRTGPPGSSGDEVSFGETPGADSLRTSSPFLLNAVAPNGTSQTNLRMNSDDPHPPGDLILVQNNSASSMKSPADLVLSANSASAPAQLQHSPRLDSTMLSARSAPPGTPGYYGQRDGTITPQQFEALQHELTLLRRELAATPRGGGDFKRSTSRGRGSKILKTSSVKNKSAVGSGKASTESSRRNSLKPSSSPSGGPPGKKVVGSSTRGSTPTRRGTSSATGGTTSTSRPLKKKAPPTTRRSRTSSRNVSRSVSRAPSSLATSRATSPLKPERSPRSVRFSGGGAAVSSTNRNQHSGPHRSDLFHSTSNAASNRLLYWRSPNEASSSNSLEIRPDHLEDHTGGRSRGGSSRSIEMMEDEETYYDYSTGGGASGSAGDDHDTYGDGLGATSNSMTRGGDDDSSNSISATMYHYDAHENKRFKDDRRTTQLRTRAGGSSSGGLGNMSSSNSHLRRSNNASNRPTPRGRARSSRPSSMSRSPSVKTQNSVRREPMNRNYKPNYNPSASALMFIDNKTSTKAVYQPHSRRTSPVKMGKSASLRSRDFAAPTTRRIFATGRTGVALNANYGNSNIYSRHHQRTNSSITPRRSRSPIPMVKKLTSSMPNAAWRS